MRDDQCSVPDPNELVMTSVRLTRAMRDELEAAAGGYRHGRSAIIREAIEDKLRQLRAQGG